MGLVRPYIKLISCYKVAVHNFRSDLFSRKFTFYYPNNLCDV